MNRMPPKMFSTHQILLYMSMKVAIPDDKSNDVYDYLYT